MMDEKLREDFPIDWDDDQYVSRREFLKFMTLASGGLAVGSAALATWAQLPTGERAFDAARIAAFDEIPIGGSLNFSYPREQDLCILIRPNAVRFVAYSRRCTHLSCPVEWQADRQRIYCPCHNGVFSATDGSVVQGPPPRPLPRIVLEIRDDGIYAVGVRLPDA